MYIERVEDCRELLSRDSRLSRGKNGQVGGHWVPSLAYMKREFSVLRKGSAVGELLLEVLRVSYLR